MRRATGNHVLPTVALVLATFLPASAQEDRGSRLIPTDTPPLQQFDPAQSAGFFVGVRTFSADKSLAEVPYAVDDAVDLAYLFSIELGLIPPGRLILALSGEVQKHESRRRLKTLIEAGALTHGASQAEFYSTLLRQARTAHGRGIFVVAIATHGFDNRGIHYLTSATSILDFIDRTGIAASDVFDTVSESEASRRIVLIDACRERLTANRSPVFNERSRMTPELAQAISQIEGQVIFTAARVGAYAYDDGDRGNGVFTGAILDGLRCRAETDGRGFVTIQTLGRYVNSRIVEWVRIFKGPSFARTAGIESNLGGAASEMPLVSCLDPDVEDDDKGDLSRLSPGQGGSSEPLPLSPSGDSSPIRTGVLRTFKEAVEIWCEKTSCRFRVALLRENLGEPKVPTLILTNVTTSIGDTSFAGARRITFFFECKLDTRPSGSPLVNLIYHLTIYVDSKPSEDMALEMAMKELGTLKDKAFNSSLVTALESIELEVRNSAN